MAASLSRPDPTSPASVAEAGFATARRGYSPDEVRAFLVSVATEMRRLHERERQLEAELRAARAAMPGRLELDDETATTLLGEETMRVLQTARESASQIKVRAEESAARVLRESHDEANRLRQEAEVDSARRRHDAQSEAEAEVALAKQQGREMVNEARAYRERVLADLERRTKLARQHIDDLAQGRERLLQVFERARLVAVDVTSELQAITGPDEFVNLAATTGPLPLMVPGTTRGSPRPPAHADEVAPPDPVDADVTVAIQTIDHDPSPVVDDTMATEPDAGSEADDHDDDHDAGDAGDTDTAVDEPAPPASVGRDHNVVDLFPSRPDDVVGGSGDDDPADQERPDVGDIFARLRSEVPADRASELPDADVTPGGSPAAPAPEPDLAAQPAGDVDEPAALATPFSRRDEAIVPLIVTAARKVKRVLADEQNGVLDTLRRREPVGAVDAILPSVEAHVAVFADAIAEELIAAAAAGAVEVGAGDSKTFRRSLAKAGALDGARALVRSDLVDPLRDRIERSVTDGAGDNEEITRRVRAVYREWKTQHIDDQLDDVFRYAFGGGIAVTVDPGAAMHWAIDPSEPACADCEDNSLAGSVAAGDPYPTGHTAAPAHPGCRCLTLPVSQ